MVSLPIANYLSSGADTCLAGDLFCFGTSGLFDPM